MNFNIFARISVALFVMPIIIIGAISAFDKDQTVSKDENRTLKQKPEFSVISLVSGDLTKDFDEYYADTFPNRSGFMKINKKINAFFSQRATGSDNIVIINRDNDENDFKGEALTEK
ncbi:MAG: DHHW family protein [Acutalibacteraceae bacterium]|jgi:hypothetical protein